MWLSRSLPPLGWLSNEVLYLPGSLAGEQAAIPDLQAAGLSASAGFAEADGNRTRQGPFDPSPVLKTGEPTRRSDASVAESSCEVARRGVGGVGELPDGNLEAGARCHVGV